MARRTRRRCMREAFLRSGSELGDMTMGTVVWGTDDSETLDANDGITNDNDAIWDEVNEIWIYSGDLVFAGGGNDTVHALGGVDMFKQKTAYDTVYGDEGDDVLFGGE